MENRKTVSSGVFWSTIERFASQGVQFIFSFIIARILTPEDYGLVAMFSIFVAVSQCLVDSGFSNALIQKKDRNEVDFSTAFFFNIFCAILIYVILCISAPCIASFYNQPLLEDIIYVSGLVIVIQSLTIVQLVKISINLEFKKQAIASLISVMISGVVAFYMAKTGYGVWALVWQTLINSIINCVLLWIIFKWYPRYFFSYESFKKLFGFGYKLSIGGLIHQIYTNVYSLIIGKVYTKTELGLFNRANSLTQYPSTNIAYVLLRVFYPVECELQDEDIKLTEAYFKYIRLSTFIVAPLMLGIAAIAHPLIDVILTSKWLGSVPYIQILCIAYLWEPIMMITWSILNAKHRSDLSLKTEIYKKVVAFVILFASIPFGVKIMCFGLFVYSISDIMIISQYTKNILPELTFFKIMKNIVPILGCAVLMALLVLLVNSCIHSSIIKLVVGIFVGCISYFSLCKLFKLEESYIFYSKIKSLL